MRRFNRKFFMKDLLASIKEHKRQERQRVKNTFLREQRKKQRLKLVESLGPFDEFGPAKGSLASVERLTQWLDIEQRPHIIRLRLIIKENDGKNFGSFDLNQQWASSLQELMDRLKVAAKCPTCGGPSRIRCLQSGRSLTGTFQFDHVIDGRRTTHGGTTKFPAFELVPAPPDKRRRAKAKS